MSEPDSVLFKHDRMYRHNIMRINYTTYDVRRKQESINPATPHCDIMVLSDNEHSSDHPFIYARVIGIFHVNVVYTGSRTVDYHPHRIDFLWVRWFESDSSAAAGGWTTSTLDRLRFPPMADEDAFGFLDPADVVRCAHILPAFATGKRHIDGKGLSRCAMDSGDWRSYYVNRCVHVRPFRPHDIDVSPEVSQIVIYSCAIIGASRLDMCTLTTDNAHKQGCCGLPEIITFNRPPTQKLPPAPVVIAIGTPIPGAMVNIWMRKEMIPSQSQMRLYGATRENFWNSKICMVKMLNLGMRINRLVLCFFCFVLLHSFCR